MNAEGTLNHTSFTPMFRVEGCSLVGLTCAVPITLWTTFSYWLKFPKENLPDNLGRTLGFRARIVACMLLKF